MKTRAFLAAAAVLLSLAACGDGGSPAAAPAVPTPNVTTASPTPSPTPASPSPEPTLSRKQACQQAVEASLDWVYLAADIAQDDSLTEVPASRIEELTGRLRDTLPYLPADARDAAMELIYPLDTVLGVMATGQNTTIDFESGKDAMLPLMRNCPKVNLKGYKPLGSDW